MSKNSGSTGEPPHTAVVIAAGEGTRLRPLTANRPKPLLPVAGRPILEYVFDALRIAGIEEIHVVVGYGSDRVRSQFGPEYRDVPLTYHHQDNQLGSGHAVLQAREAIEDTVLVVNGDQVIDAEMVETVSTVHADAQHSDDGCSATLAVVEADRAPEYGAVRLEGDRIVEHTERPADESYRLLNAGVYTFEPDVLDHLDSAERLSGELPLPVAISSYIEQGEFVQGVRTDAFWRDATYPWDLLELSREILTRGWLNCPEIRTNVYVAESARVHDDATLIAPVVLGNDVVIEAGAVVGPNVSVGVGSTVSAGSVVRNTVLDTDTRVGANATADALVTGQDTRLGADATVPGGPGDVRINREIHENIDLGAVLADRAVLGGGTIATNGALIGPDAEIGAGTLVQTNVESNAEVRR